MYCYWMYIYRPCALCSMECSKL